ncbi:hypothetical protein [Prevotella sp. HUN102]|uniref:hypothetical protein n=1 Tax=Prevotella sp. HUN102 TaxID=1392486 RepID=UPI00048F4FBA|nr:hypothetical protein [Prevotella sp. HUN102]
MKDIELTYKDKTFIIPNRWDGMTQSQYTALCADLLRMEAGELSAGEVRINHLCRLMSWNRRRFRTEEQIANLISISERLTFLFQISYPDGNAVLEALDDNTYRLCRRVDPFRLSLPIARVLRKMEYRYVVDLCFCAQLIPVLTIDGKDYNGYRVITDCNRLSCSLTALQYIEARELLDKGTDALPLLAAILYHPEPEYDSGKAHALAPLFARNLSVEILTAVAFNFQAFNSYLFSKTPFSLLGKFEPSQPSPITTDASDAIYDLSKEGLGNVHQIEQMNLLTYLKVLRKKTIDAVRTLKGFGWDKAKISSEVGLPIGVIDKII